jgi:glutaredoxin
MSCCDRDGKGNLIIYELADKNFNNDGTLIGRHPYMMVLFKMRGCPHCEHIYPTWMKLVNEYRRATCVCFSEVEATQRKVTRSNVMPRGFPTIRLYDIPRGKIYEYNGNRTFDDMARFIDSHM